MAIAVRVYFEGDRSLRIGFSKFFEGFRLPGIRIAPVPCKANAIADFMSGLKSYPKAVNVLLIDAEKPYATNLFQEVRQHDHWDYATGLNVSDDRIHFMVQVMESWFLADKQALSAYYGRSFAANRLPPNPAIEEIPKDDVLSGLSDATRATTKGRYHKTNHGPRLLEAIDPAKVRAAAPNCSRLFDFLNSLVSQSP